MFGNRPVSQTAISHSLEESFLQRIAWQINESLIYGIRWWRTTYQEDKQSVQLYS